MILLVAETTLEGGTFLFFEVKQNTMQSYHLLVRTGIGNNLYLIQAEIQEDMSLGESTGLHWLDQRV